MYLPRVTASIKYWSRNLDPGEVIPILRSHEPPGSTAVTPSSALLRLFIFAPFVSGAAFHLVLVICE